MTITVAWTDPSEAGTLDLDTGDTLTDAVWDALVSNIGHLGGTAGLLACTDAGLVTVNDTSNAKMTVGITINQGANDNEALALKSSDVAHGVTDQTETDTYGTMSKISATSGGLGIIGLSEATESLNLSGIGVTDDTGKTTGSGAYINLDAHKKTGTAFGAVGANGNLVRIRNYNATQFILDADGDSHQNVGTAWTNFDDFDDLSLLTALSVQVSRPADPIKQAFREYIELHRDTLEKAKLVTFNEDGHHFVNMSKLTMLLVGAVRQIGREKAAIEGRLARIESRLALLPDGGM